MCGIVGTISVRGNVDLELLVRQRDAMTHRGPDSSGIWSSPGGEVAFGHRRLAIIDLSPGGHQPMAHHASGCVITFNGEIYNYVVLRKELTALGHAFVSESDTEVILAAYGEWGDRCVARLEGMFAFALFDPNRRQVLLARDRAGEKPLYFRTANGSTSFASEVKALLRDPGCSRRVRLSALNEYLAYGYTTGSSSIFDDIHRVEPGCQLCVSLEDGMVSTSRYWELPVHRTVNTTDDGESLVAQLHDLLRTAVTRQLVADVPVGVLLSGGVDSSIIAAIAAEVSRSSISTFTVRFADSPLFDEGPFARLVASHLGTTHLELDARPSSTDVLRRLVEQFDEPMADSSMIPMFLVSEEIRRHATVAIGGDGGDELFGGYRRYPQFIRMEQLRGYVPASARRALAALGSVVIPEGGSGRGVLQGFAGDHGGSIASAGRIFRDDERVSVSPALAGLPAEKLRAPERRRSSHYSDRSSIIQRATAVDFSTYMVDDVLVKVDRASMLSSLEVRAPFLDSGVIDFAFGKVPDELRATGSERKVLLKRLGARLLPPELDLSRKQGFSIPLAEWLRGMWRPFVTEMASDSSPSLVSSQAIARLQALLDEGRPVESRLFCLVVLRMWERVYGINDVSDS